MSIFIKIAVLLLAGFIGGKIAKHFYLPSVTGFLIAGLFLGPSMGLLIPEFSGIITDYEQNSLGFIKEIALAFIAFSIGSEFSFHRIKQYGKTVNTVAILESVFAIFFIFLAVFLLPKGSAVSGEPYAPFNRYNFSMSLLLASMGAATAPAATIMVVRQFRAYGPLTQTVLPVTALDDVYGIIAFGFACSISQILTTHAALPLWFLILKPFIEVSISIIIGLIIGFILAIIIQKIEKDRDEYQVLSLTAIFLAIGCVMQINSVFAHYNIGISSLLTTITIGATLANALAKPDTVFDSLNDLSMPFMVLFFTLAGANLNLNIFRSSSSLILVALFFMLARASGKYFGAFLGAELSGADKKMRNYIGFALLPQGGVSIGLLVMVANMLPDFYSSISTIIMISVLFFETTGPIFAKFAISRAGEINGLDTLTSQIPEEHLPE